MFRGEHGCRGSVFEVDPGEDAAAADDRKLPFAHRLDQCVVGGAVEGAVAQRDPAEVGDDSFEMAQRGEDLLHVGRWGCLKRIVLGVDRSAHPGVPVGGKALRNEATHPGLARGRQQPSVPFVRSSLVLANVLSMLRLNFAFASAVA